MRLAAGILIGVLAFSASGSAATRQGMKPTFKSAVNLVTVSAVVRKRNGPPVVGLKRDDFEVFDNGEKQPITEFQSMSDRVSLALLVDFSGSMEVAAKMGAAHEVAAHLLDWLTPGTDDVGLFTFDSELHELQPLGPAPGSILVTLDGAHPFGATSLYDAVAGAGQAIVAHGGPRRAIIAITDGADNHSRMTPQHVTAIASSIDVPVYILVVISPYDRSGSGVLDEKGLDAIVKGPLGDLARSTGGDIFAPIGTGATSLVARQIVTELRQQYLMAFTPGATPGWHAIDVRMKNKDLVVRARSGYNVSAEPGAR